MSATVDLAPSARAVADLLPSVRDEHLGAPTPCADYTVADLLRHLLGLTEAFRAVAAKQLGPLTDAAPDTEADPLPDDWRRVLPDRLAAMAAAWQDDGAWQGMTRAGGVDLPGASAGLVACDELVLHGWDLARAVDGRYEPDPEAVRASLEVLAELVGPDAERGTAFGEPVPVRAEAPPLDRAVALSGRDPSWTPPAG